MVKAFKLGLMALSTKAGGRIIRLVDEAVSFTAMVICTLACGSTTKLMVTANTYIKMELVTKEIGTKISSMVKESKHGLTVPNMRVSTLMGRSMAQESLRGLMEIFIMANLKKTICRVMVYMNGWMGGHIKDSGK